MSEHTPGPWELLDKTRVSVTLPPTISNVGYSSHCVALVTGHDKRLNWEANARLIAAAPELLEALKAALAYSDAVTDAEGRGAFSWAAQARAAIAKATGEA